MNRSLLVIYCLGLISIMGLSSCSSAKKERLEQREKLANSSGLYCDFVNGEKYTDVEVMMNLEMAKRCDSSKPFSISGYKSPSEVIGMMYCCAVARKPDPSARLSPMNQAPRPAAPATAATSAPTPVANSGSALTPAPSANTPAAKPAATTPAPSKPSAPNDISDDEVLGE